MPELEIILIACVVATACVLPGVFLILRGMALMSDAISHAILLGIVLSFFVVRHLNSPFLIIGATLAGILTVTATELLVQTQRLKKDAAIGLVFPVFFSIGVILINQFTRDIHIDTDAVILGELAFAPFNRFILWGIDLGPKALWVMGSILVFNMTMVKLFFKELKLATFDAGLASTLGFSPVWIHYGLMTMTSITAVGAFDAVGSILVVALMITPPATAYMLTEKLGPMIAISVGVGLLSAIVGYGAAHWADVSIAGTMASMTGVLFLLALFFSPRRGLLNKVLIARRQRITFSAHLVMVQLLAHEGQPNENEESTVSHLLSHMNWTAPFATQVVRKAVQERWIFRDQNRLFLTPLGREMAKESVVGY